MNEELRIPDVEIIVGASSSDVAHFCFYRRAEIHEGYDVVCYIHGASARAVVSQILQDALTALRGSQWYDVDELRSLVDPEVEDPPF